MIQRDGSIAFNGAMREIQGNSNSVAKEVNEHQQSPTPKSVINKIPDKNVHVSVKEIMQVLYCNIYFQREQAHNKVG